MDKNKKLDRLEKVVIVGYIAIMVVFFTLCLVMSFLR